MNRILRTAICALLAVMIAMGTVPAVMADSGNFAKMYDYGPETFSDVVEDDWFYGNVIYVFEHGLMNGKGQGRFDPAGNITVAEALTIAARINRIYTEGDDTFEKTSPWYSAYSDYCRDKGLLDGIEIDPEGMNGAASRRLFAAI